MESQIPTPPTQPETPARHFLNKKFLVTIAALLLVAGGAYAGMFYWQSNVNTPVVTFTPRPSDTSNSKTYTNTQFGFEFNYPNSWNSIELKGLGSNSDFEIGFDPIIKSLSKINESLTLVIQVYSNISKLDTDNLKPVDLRDYLTKYSSKTNAGYIDINNYKLGNTSGYHATPTGLDGIEDYFVESNNRIYLIETASNSNIDQILSSFKFIDVSPSPSPTTKATASRTPTPAPKPISTTTIVNGMKVYTNTKIGITLQIPQNLIIVEQPYGDRTSIGLPWEFQILKPGDPTPTYSMVMTHVLTPSDLIDKTSYSVSGIIIGGKSGTKIVMPAPDGSSGQVTEVFVTTSEGLFYSYTSKEEDAIFDQIIASIKFTK